MSSKAVEAVIKKYGQGAIALMSGSVQMRAVIPTGSHNLDLALGVGGIPRGRVTEIFGPESCLAGDTFVQYQVRTRTGRRQNNKGGTIKRLYERFNGLQVAGRGVYQREKSVNSVFYVPSMNEHGRVFQNPVHDVVICGVKECFKVTTGGGCSIVTTPDHRFCTVGGDFVQLYELDVGDVVFVHNGTPYRESGKSKRQHRSEVVVKHHRHWREKVVDGKYVYRRGWKSHAVLEAHMNGMEYEQYIGVLNTGGAQLDELWTVPAGYEVHHVDGDTENDVVENLLLMDVVKHHRMHAQLNHNKLRFMVVPDDIVRIEPVGEIETYDIKCIGPHNNYVANKFVVHNSGKTTLAQHILANAQLLGGKVAIIDSEHATDPAWAAICGLDLDQVYLSQPDTMEQALDTVEILLPDFDVVMFDSVAASVPRAELEGEFGDAHMALQARLMSQALRKLTGSIRETNCAVVFTNQLRGTMATGPFAKKSVTSGGRALKFYASVRLELWRGKRIEHKGEPVGNEVGVNVVKNKVAPPFKKTQLAIFYDEGVSLSHELLGFANDLELIEKGGAGWWTFFPGTEDAHKVQGVENARQAMLENKHLRYAVDLAVRQHFGLPLYYLED